VDFPCSYCPWLTTTTVYEEEASTEIIGCASQDDEEDFFGEDTEDELTSQKQILHWPSRVRI
jgi:hypothetical protein